MAARIASDLDDAVAKLLVRGGGGRRSEAHAPLPVDMAASEAADELRTELARAVGMVIYAWPPRPSDPPLIPGHPTVNAARWLLARLDDLRQHPRGGEAHRGILAAVHRAVQAVDRLPERAPAGLCDNCGRQLLAELGADSVTCACGMTALALQEKRRERAAAADVLGTAAEISGALARIGITVPRGTITSWASRGRLLPRPGGAYALSDVLALHAQAKAKVRG